MDNEIQESLARFTERYTNGQVPWDDSLPPPEVQALVATLPPGRALGLTGRPSTTVGAGRGCSPPR